MYYLMYVPLCLAFYLFVFIWRGGKERKYGAHGGSEDHLAGIVCLHASEVISLVSTAAATVGASSRSCICTCITAGELGLGLHMWAHLGFSCGIGPLLGWQSRVCAEVGSPGPVLRLVVQGLCCGWQSRACAEADSPGPVLRLAVQGLCRGQQSRACAEAGSPGPVLRLAVLHSKLFYSLVVLVTKTWILKVCNNSQYS